MVKGLFNRVNLFIALQYLRSKKRQSILATLGVTLGVTTFIVLLSFMTGVNEFLDDAIFKGNPEIVIGPKANTGNGHSIALGTITPLKDPDLITRYLDEEYNVASLSRQIVTPAILISQDGQFPVTLNGIVPDQEVKMVDLDRRLVQGDGFVSINKPGNVLLGSSLADKLGIRVGDDLKVVLINQKMIKLRVSGIFSFGISNIDQLRAYMKLDRLEHLLSDESLTTHIHVKLKERDDLKIKSKLQERFPDIVVSDWKESNKTIVVGNKVRNVLTWSVSAALLLVAGLGIFNILNITVIQKRKDIAVFKTMGYSPEDLTSIFLIKSIAIGLTGSILGGVLGYFISSIISGIPLDTSDFIIAETYPIKFDSLYYFIAMLFGLLTAVISGYFPAKRASNTDPVHIIREA